MNGSPFHGVGRPMKVGKEEIAGLVTALELWADPKFEKQQLTAWEELTSRFIELMSGVRGLRVRRGVSPPPSSGRALNPSWVPLAHMEWNQADYRLTPQQVADELRRGEPGIIIPAIPTGLMFSPQCIEPGDEVVVAERLKAVLEQV
jgi:L-seryl-tRNA(Ser) seleniumtransferase